MPILPAIGTGLAALGGGSAAVGATIAATAVGAGATLIGSNNAANAARDAGQLQYQAAQDANATNLQIFNQQRADNEPFRQTGLAAASALSGAFGLGTPSMTSSGYSTGGATGSPMTGGPAAPQVDAIKYLQDNPDALANFQALRGSGRTDAIATDPTAFVLNHWQDDGARRELPTIAQASAAPAKVPEDGGYAAPPGYNDPTAPNGYSTPARPMTAPLDVSTGAFRESPGYQFSLEQGNKAIGNIAAANRSLMSGQRLKAAGRYNVGMADQEFTNWRDYTTNQYNYDRNFGESTYQADRGRNDQRYDQRNQTLLQMAGFGSAANAQNQSAAQSFANNNAALTMTGAQARGDAGVTAANAWNQGLNGIMTTGAYLAGQFGGGAPTAWNTPQIQTPSYMQFNPQTGMTGRY